MSFIFLVLIVLIAGCVGSSGSKEQVLVNTMDKILSELSIENHKVLSKNFEIGGDSLSGNIEAQLNEVLTLNTLKTGPSGWESRDILVEGDSVDSCGSIGIWITFEKDYPAVAIDGRKYIPRASVALSVTVLEDEGYSDVKYDIDITLGEFSIS